MVHHDAQPQPRNADTPLMQRWGIRGSEYTLEDVMRIAGTSRSTVLRARRIERHGLADAVLFHGMSTAAALYACDLLDLRRGAA